VRLRPDDPSGTGDRPLGIALHQNGLICVGLRGGTQNVKRYDWDGSFIDDFTESIGGFGTGQIAFNADGDLVVAGDVSQNHSVFRYDGETGQLIDHFNLAGFRNLVGVMVHGSFAYAPSLFTDAVVRFDLSSNPVIGVGFIDAPDQLEWPIGMTISHRSTIIVANARDPRLQEFDLATGQFLGTFVDLSPHGAGGALDVKYSQDLDRYYVTDGGNRILEFSPAGQLLNVFSSTLVSGIYSLAVVADPRTAVADEPIDDAATPVSIAHNPVSGSFTITIQAGPETFRNASIFDVLGRHVAKLLPNAVHSSGITLVWDGRDDSRQSAPRGLYILRIATSDRVIRQKLTVVR